MLQRARVAGPGRRGAAGPDRSPRERGAGGRRLVPLLRRRRQHRRDLGSIGRDPRGATAGQGSQAVAQLRAPGRAVRRADGGARPLRRVDLDRRRPAAGPRGDRRIRRPLSRGGRRGPRRAPRPRGRRLDEEAHGARLLFGHERDGRRHGAQPRRLSPPVAPRPRRAPPVPRAGNLPARHLRAAGLSRRHRPLRRPRAAVRRDQVFAAPDAAPRRARHHVVERRAVAHGGDGRARALRLQRIDGHLHRVAHAVRGRHGAGLGLDHPADLLHRRRPAAVPGRRRRVRGPDLCDRARSPTMDRRK